MTIDTPTDHWDYANTVQPPTFPLRVLVNDTYWRDDKSAILFYTGNEGDIEMFAQNTGWMWEMASLVPHGALVVFCEHRYYGESSPYPVPTSLPLSPDAASHLRFLTVEQTLADFTHVLSRIRSEYNATSRTATIAIGGSYGGMLSAWWKFRQPFTIHGAIASSAPMLQFDGLMPHDDISVFYQIVTRDFSQYAHCAESIRSSWGAIDALFASTTHREALKQVFSLCDASTLDKENDVVMLKEFMSEAWIYMAMTNYPYETTFLAPLPATPVGAACKAMEGGAGRQLEDAWKGSKRAYEAWQGRIARTTASDTSASDTAPPPPPTDAELEQHLALLRHIRAGLDVFYNTTNSCQCHCYSPATPQSNLGDVSWEYQSCTQLVIPMSSNGVNDMFEPAPWDEAAVREYCESTFHVQPTVHWARDAMGGKHYEYASNILFPNGLLDPWSGGGLLQDASRTVRALIIPEGAHHLDLRASHRNDPSSVRRVRRDELDTVMEWIEEAIHAAPPDTDRPHASPRTAFRLGMFLGVCMGLMMAGGALMAYGLRRLNHIYDRMAGYQPLADQA